MTPKLQLVYRATVMIGCDFDFDLLDGGEGWRTAGDRHLRRS